MWITIGRRSGFKSRRRPFQSLCCEVESLEQRLTLTAGTTTAIIDLPSTIYYSSPAQGYVQVQPVTSGSGNPTGQVAIFSDSIQVATATITGFNDNASPFYLSGITAGNHTQTAVYSGDSNFAPSTSAPVEVTVQKAY